MSVIHVNSEIFTNQILTAEKTVLLDFWATWCGPCKMIAPLVEEIARQREDILVGKVNVDEEMELAVQFGITSIPTLVVMKQGQVTATAVGYRPMEDILALLDK